MIIKINNQVLDVTLENEKTVYDVVSSLGKELAKKEIVITTVEVDDKTFSSGDKVLNDMPLEGVGVINVEASSKDELVINLLEESKKVLSNISVDIKKNAFLHCSEFNELLQWVRETIDTINRLSVFNLVESNLIISTINQVCEYLNSPDKEESKISSIASIMESLINYIDAIEVKIGAHFEVKKEEVVEMIDNTLQILPEISEAFQIGKDKEAFDKINEVINMLEICCIYIKKNVSSFSADKKDSIQKLYEGINSLLIQIVDAFEKGDAVLLGDLLEYELPDKLENYKSLILEG